MAAAVLGNLPLLHVPLYILGQVVGAVAGYGLVKVDFVLQQLAIAKPN